MNRYAYASGEPINANDPSGLEYCAPVSIVCQVPVGILDGGDGGIDPGSDGGGGVCPGGDGSGAVDAYFGGIPGLAPCGIPIVPASQGGGSGACLNWCLMPAAFSLAEQWLENQSCDQLFGTTASRAGAFSPSSFLAAYVWGYSPYGGVSFASMWILGGVARTYPTPNGAHTFINTYNPGPNNAYWNVGDALENAITLLHEMGHAYSYLSIYGSGGSAMKWDGTSSTYNDQLIERDCVNGSGGTPVQI